MLLRVALALALVTVIGLTALPYRRRRSGPGAASPLLVDGAVPAVPAGFLGGAEHTWLVFTTPYCATCGPVEARLRAADPAASVVRVDATRELRLAGDLGIRAAPTALLADAAGKVEVRLVGPAAVDRYLTDTARP